MLNISKWHQSLMSFVSPTIMMNADGQWGPDLGYSNNQSNSLSQLKLLQDQVAKLQGIQASNNANVTNPFGAAMSGTQHDTLQPYINQQTQQASDALNGGLLGQSMPMQSGNAGGMPMTATQPQFDLTSALANFKGFGNRAWMNK